MSFQLELDGHPREALCRAASERLEHALRQLDQREKDPVSAVHEARKDVKKLRALVRLYRDNLGEGTYRRENQALRDAARELSDLRDGDVVLESVDRLAERYAGQVPQAAVAGLRTRLDGKPVAAPSADAVVDDARDQLATILRRVERWPGRARDARFLAGGLAQSYERGRRAFKLARRAPSDETLHDWRKRVKDLAYQQQLVRRAWPAVLGAQAKAAQQLAELIGDDHDLAVLTERLSALEAFPYRDEVAALAVRRRRELQDEALGLARRVYAEPAKRYEARIERYLRAAIRDADRAR